MPEIYRYGYEMISEVFNDPGFTVEMLINACDAYKITAVKHDDWFSMGAAAAVWNIILNREVPV